MHTDVVESTQKLGEMQHKKYAYTRMSLRFEEKLIMEKNGFEVPGGGGVSRDVT